MATERASQLVDDVLSSVTSRAHFLKGAAVAAASLGLPAAAAASPADGGAGGGGRGKGAGMAEPVQEILSIAATAEALAVTALYHVHLQVGAGKFNTSGIAVPASTLVSVVRAALREEADHYSFLTGAGGRAIYTSFTVPADILTSAVAALRFLEIAETAFVAAYMAANREFAGAGMASLAQYAYQIGGTECEHRTLVRAALGEMPPNNKSFETNLFGTVADAAKELASLGLFKPGIPFPGIAAVNSLLASTVTHDVNAGVAQRHP